MPKLDKKKAAAVAKAESMDFAAIPDGLYTLRLREVNTADKSGNPLIGQATGDPYWSWQFEVVSPEKMLDPDLGKEVKTASRRLFMTTSLGETSEWALKAAFEAFGYTTDSDTDEFIGDLVQARVSRGPIAAGKRKGEIGNNIDRLIAYEQANDADAAEGWDDDE